MFNKTITPKKPVSRLTPYQKTLHKKILEQARMSQNARRICHESEVPELAKLIKSAALEVALRKYTHRKFIYTYFGKKFYVHYTGWDHVQVTDRETDEFLGQTMAFFF